MTAETELDPILRAWLSGDGHRVAPDWVLRGALDEVAGVRQRRSGLWSLRRWLAPGPTAARRLTLRLALVAIVVAALAVSIAIGVGNSVPRQDPSPPAPSPLATSDIAPLPGFSSRTYADLGIEATVPSGWVETASNADYVLLSGTEPAGFLSVSHASPLGFTVCSPRCDHVGLPQHVPYGAAQTRAEVEAKIAQGLGGGIWTDLAEGSVAEVDQPRRLDVTVTDASGLRSRRSYLFGLHQDRIVLLVLTQPEEAYRAGLVDQILSGFRVLPGGPNYGFGKTFVTRTDPGGHYQIDVPDNWTGEQALGDSGAIAGLRRFGDDDLTIGVGSLSGGIGVCDPTCRAVPGPLTVAELVQALPPSNGLGWAVGSVVLDGETVTVLRSPAGASPRLEHVIAVRDDQAVVITFDLSSGLVTRAAVDQMIASFRFVPPPVLAPPVLVLTAPDKSFHVGFGDGVQAIVGKDSTALYAARGAARITIYAGDAAGTIRRCDRPAGPWEECDPVTVRSLEQLVEATRVKPIADHGVGPPAGAYDETRLDGEPAVVVHVNAYEYPARSGQALVHVLAMHEGRPFIIRMWTNANSFVGDEAIIRSFRFGPP